MFAVYNVKLSFLSSIQSLQGKLDMSVRENEVCAAQVLARCYTAVPGQLTGPWLIPDFGSLMTHLDNNYLIISVTQIKITQASPNMFHSHFPSF